MLSHPFYQAWTEGRLSLDTLRAYARQYFHHVEAFPRSVSAVHSACPDRDGRRMLAENLAEEEGVEAGKQDHASLWLMFACGLGESEEEVRSQQLNTETRALIDTFRRLSRQSYAAGLGGILVPVTLDRMRIDPAVSSAVFVTTITDVTGFFSFLGLATLVGLGR
jgi:pyrroloquinoline-quinone synthase